MTEVKKQSITNWALEDRPREKMLAKGIFSLSDAELLAILIGSGNQKETAVALSQRILQSCMNNLNELARYSVNDLCRFNGIGEAKAITIVAALELGKRQRTEKIIQKKQIASSRDIFELFYPIINDLPYEEMWVLLLNRSNKIIDKRKISQGGVSNTTVDIRLILKTAIETLASGIVLCHNHPSGNRMPSNNDKIITRKTAEAAKIMDMQLLDHVIIANDSYFSFIDEGEITVNS